jgi:hypothetical protein
MRHSIMEEGCGGAAQFNGARKQRVVTGQGQGKIYHAKACPRNCILQPGLTFHHLPIVYSNFEPINGLDH